MSWSVSKFSQLVDHKKYFENSEENIHVDIGAYKGYVKIWSGVSHTRIMEYSVSPGVIDRCLWLVMLSIHEWLNCYKIVATVE